MRNDQSRLEGAAVALGVLVGETVPGHAEAKVTDVLVDDEATTDGATRDAGLGAIGLEGHRRFRACHNIQPRLVPRPGVATTTRGRGTTRGAN